MKKIFISIIFVLLLSVSNLLANQVSIEEVQNVAKNWYLERCKEDSISQFNIVETYTESRNSGIVFYIFNFTPSGYVIVSADDIAYPILGYSKSNSYETINHPPAFDDLLEWYALQIDSVRTDSIAPFEETTELWNRLNVNPEDFVPETDGKVVLDPLLSTKWAQGYPYNSQCPTIDGEHCLVGCVAVSMGQVMKYHNWPNFGTASHSYSWNGQTISADFNTNYKWNNMPNSLVIPSPSQAEIDATAKLLFHSGVSVEMDYGLSFSGAYHEDVVNALQDYFYYDQDISIIYKDDYINNIYGYHSLINNNLDDGYPVVYGGFGVFGGHSFVLDGYYGGGPCLIYYYHINWGWEGYYNDWYRLDNLTPNGWNFNYCQSAIINIKPLGGTIEGIVTLIGGSGNAEDVKVSVGGAIVNPDSDGNFSIRLFQGTYSVTAYLSGYNPQTIENVEVIEGQTTTGIDFSLQEGFVVYVNQDGLGDYLTIQGGINAAEDGDIIVVADGIYTGTNNTNLTWNGTVKHLTVRSENGPENCIIDCENINAGGFYLINNQDQNDRIIGFTIKNSDNYAAIYGRNIIIYNNIIENCYRGIKINANDDVTITYNTIIDCSVYGDGGGIYCNAPGLIAYNTVENCTTYSGGNSDLGCGGGIYANNVNMLISNNSISYCRARRGGGIYAVQAYVYNNTIDNCWVEDAFCGGGGIFGWSGEINNNKISYCSAFADDSWTGGYGSAIAAGYVNLIHNNELKHNYTENGGTITVFDGNPVITNNLIDSNSVYCHAPQYPIAAGISSRHCGEIVIEGNTISNGQSDDSAYSNGINAESVTVRCLLKDNLIFNHNGSGIIGTGDYYAEAEFTIENCTVANNWRGICIDNYFTNISINNCIVSNNYGTGICNFSNNDPDISFSDICENGTNYSNCSPGVGCIEENPQFADNYSLQWDENGFSPCIDTGDPDEIYNDADGTPSDMGAIPAITHKYNNWQLPPNSVDNGWKWLSFPALDDLTNNPGVYVGDMAQYMLADILDPDTLEQVIWKPILDQGSNLLNIHYEN